MDDPPDFDMDRDFPDLPTEGSMGLRGADQFVVREGPGHEVITGFSTLIGDMLIFDRFEMQTASDVMSRLHPSGNDSLIRFDDGGTLRLVGLDPATLNAAHVSCLGGPVQFSYGTMVEIEAGQCRVEDLVEGDLLQTVDHGLQPLRQLTRQRRVFKGPDDPSRPVVVSFGALGRGCPRRPLIVSPTQRLGITHPASGAEMLISATKLVGRAGVQRVRGCVQADFISLRCDQHELIRAEGLIAETLLTMPRGATARNVTPMTPARPIYLKDPAFHADRLDPRFRASHPDVA